jgi:hypothetical protein
MEAAASAHMTTTTASAPVLGKHWHGREGE